MVIPASERRGGESDAEYLARISRFHPKSWPISGETEDEFHERMARLFLQKANITDGRLITIEEEFPPNRDFRNAWAHTGSKVEVDMPRARDIHMNRIRVGRDAELEKQVT